MAYLEDKDLERAARNLRLELGIDDQLRPDMTLVLQKMKHHGYIVDYARVPDHLMPDAEAKFNPDERRLHLRDSTYRAAQQTVPRSRWTIAHELGHVALNHIRTRHRSALPREIERIAPTIRRDEAQAHKFAAAFLAPFHRADFSSATTPEEIAHRFGISLPAARRRVDEFAQMYRRLLGIPRPLPQGIVDFLAEAQRKGHKVMSLVSSETLAEHPRTIYYEGDVCPGCNNFMLVRNGLNMKCDYCGTITGND